MGSVGRLRYENRYKKGKHDTHLKAFRGKMVSLIYPLGSAVNNDGDGYAVCGSDWNSLTRVQRGTRVSYSYNNYARMCCGGNRSKFNV